MSATLLDKLLLSAPALSRAAEALGRGDAAGRVPLARPAWAWTLVALRRSLDRPLVAIAPGDEEARDLARDAEALLGRAAVGLWPTIGVPAGMPRRTTAP